jgi:capsular exopolysaccharide synthesis family protein
MTSFNPAFIERLVISPNPNRQLLEQFRALGAALHRAQTLSGTKTVMITSAEPHEGKTLTAVNLALILSESYGRRVLLIDADLRRPSIKEIAEVSDLPGLNEALKSRYEQKLAVVRITDRLTLLPAGQPDPDPLRGLTSARMSRILAEAASGFDWVILDAPPIGPIADAGLLGSLVDTALLVVRAGRTPHAAVQRAVESIGRDRIFGVILNGAEGVAEGQYGEYSEANDPHVKH